MSLALDTTPTTLTPPPTVAPRLPSTRPIDQRWDQSRGIVFSNAQRSTLRDQTWSHARGVSIAPFSTMSRLEVHAPLGPARKAPEAKVTTRTPIIQSTSTQNSSRSTSPTAPTFTQTHKGASSVVLTGYQTEQLLQSNKSMEAKIAALEETVKTGKEERSRLADEIQAQKLAYANLEKTSRNDTKPEYERRIRKLHESHHSAIEDLKREGRDEASKLERWYMEELNRNPEYTKIVQDLKKQEEERRVIRTQEQESRNREEKEHRRRIQELQRREDERAHETQQKQRDLDDKIIETERTWAESLAMLDERSQRSETDRSSYTEYRNLYDEHVQNVMAVLEHFNRIEAELEYEAKSWKADEINFEHWKTKVAKLFDHIPKYKSLGKAMVEFLQSRGSQADMARKVLNQVRAQLRAEMHEMKKLAHDSRSFTRLLHLEEEQTTYETTKMVLRTTLTELFNTHVAECQQHMTDLEVSIKANEDSTEKTRLEQEWKRWRDRRRVVMQISAVADRLNEIRALEALLHDSTAEKLVYLETRQAKGTMNAVLDQYRGIRDDYHPGSHSDRQRMIKDYWEKEQDARRLVDILESSVRRLSIIQLETGDLDEEAERRKADQLIKARIDEEQKLLEEHFELLLPLRKPGTRIGRTQVERSYSMESLRPSLSQAKSVVPVRPATAGVAIRKASRPLQSSDFYEEELEQLQKKKDELLSSVDGDATKLDEAQKLQVQRFEENMKGIRRRMSRSTAPAKRSAKQASNSDAAASAAEAAESPGESQQPGKKKGKAEARKPMRTRPRQSIVRKLLSGGESPPRGALNIKPSKPMQAQHSRPAFDLHHTAEHTSSMETEAPMSWMELSDEAKMRSLSGLNLGDGHAGSSYAHDPNETSQSSFVASSVDSLNSQEAANPVVGTDTQAEPAITEGDSSMEMTYHMSAKDLRAAATASPNSSAAYWSHKLYKGDEGISPKVFYCTSFETAEKQAKLFLDEPVLGFDLEWEPRSSLATSTIKRSLSLIQIASEDKIGLFQIALFKGETADELMPPTLRKILESPDVVKSGVNVAGDTRRMQACLNVEMKGVMELSHLYRVVKFSADQPKLVNFKLVSLADQVHSILLLPLRKDDNRMSSWSRHLNGQQTDYAATDAYAGFRLYHELEKRRKAMTPTPPRLAFFETMLPIVLGNGDVVERSSKRSAGAVASKKTAAEVDEGEEDEEFFDAEEELDTYGLASPDRSAFDPTSASSVPQSDGPAVERSGVAYPELPQAEDASNAPDAIELEQTASVTLSQDPAPAASTSAPNPIHQPASEALSAAETWISEYRLSLPKNTQPTARQSELRAYHLWHHQNLSLQVVASMMRDPPLQSQTVASYILCAIKAENFPYDVERVREPLEVLPRSVHGRYGKIVEKVKKWEREKGRGDW